MRIGIFGGSFNPPHLMHKEIAIKLVENGYLDKVIYVPTGNKYQKKGLIEAKYRYEMLKIMIENIDYLEVSDYELNNNLKYTYETLNFFKNCYLNDEIYFICGSDNLKELSTWKNYEYILSTFKILVIRRNNDNLDDINHENIIITNVITEDISSTNIRNNFKEEHIDNKVLKYIQDKKIYWA